MHKPKAYLMTPPRPLPVTFLCTALAAALLVAGAAQAETTADALIETTGFKGGVLLLLEPESLDGVTEIREKVPNSLIHVCTNDSALLETYRQELNDAGMGGTVTVSLHDGKTFPFVSNFINVLVASAPTEVPEEEVLRVLAPHGRALVAGELVTKPRPEEMDEWPQYLYDAAGSSVCQDTLLRPPLYHSQWTGSPRWSRHHDVMSSVSACVSGDDKLFYIFDEGNAFSPMLPSDWKLIARDAFNGAILWKRELPKWFPNMHSLKNGPSNIPRRLVVNDETVYATLGIEAPVSALDTTTGEIIKVLQGTERVEEIVHAEGHLYLVQDDLEDKPELANYPRSRKEWSLRKKNIICYDLETDQIAWKKTFDWVAPLTVCLYRGRLCFFDGRRVLSLDNTSGKQIWASAELDTPSKLRMNYAPRMLIRGELILFSGSGAGKRGELVGISMENGATAWVAPNPASGYQSPEDLFVIDGKAWAGDVTNHRWNKNEKDATGEFTGVNVGTGEIDERFPHVEAYWFHHRCHPGKATRNYIILNRSGTEFIDPRTGEWFLHHWTRGACLYGVMPANGMLYLPQHPCACYIGAKTYGFTVLSPKDETHPTTRMTPEDERLVTGKAMPFTSEAEAEDNTWPTYRGDLTRSGRQAKVAPPTHQEWQLELGGDLTPPVIAGNKVLVSQKDGNCLVAVDAHTGQPAWKFFPGGKVDSPPAIYKGRAYFGSADGFIYCVAIDDGTLLWKYQGAPTSTKHMWFERIESTHPVHGNVLVMNDKVYTVAGRNMFTDGGLRFLILDAETGKKLAETHMDDRMPGTDEPLQMHHEFLNMPMALTDLLSTDGKKIFMRYQQFDLDGKRIKLDYTRKRYGLDKSDINNSQLPTRTDQKGEDAHLFAGTGFLDDSWWHRSYWVFGKHYASGWPGYSAAGASGAPAGRIMSFNDERIFTWGRMRKYFRWSKTYEYLLHAKNYDYEDLWGVCLPILARSMVLSDDRIFVLGPDELVRQETASQLLTTTDMQQTMREQAEAFEGSRGSRFLVIDNTNGRILSGAPLSSVPVFDGMAAAYGKIYLSMTDGSLRCLGAAGDKLPAISEELIADYNTKSVVPQDRTKPKQKSGN